MTETHLGFNQDGFDPARRYVRVVDERADGFVAFTYAIGEPGIFVELMLRRPAFDEFCRENRVEILPPDTGAADISADGWDWTLKDARDTRFR